MGGNFALRGYQAGPPTRRLQASLPPLRPPILRCARLALLIAACLAAPAQAAAPAAPQILVSSRRVAMDAAPHARPASHQPPSSGQAAEPDSLEPAVVPPEITCSCDRRTCSCGLREFWMVSSREAPVCRGLDRGVDRLSYWKCERGRWQRHTVDEFVAAMDPSLTTTFFVHGNTLDSEGATEAGRVLYEHLGRGVPAFRLVLWSWPAERIRGKSVRANVTEKARSSESQGYYLAWLIDQIDPATPLSLTGHSFGARTVSAALQGLASGRIARHDLPERLYAGPRSIQAALVAAPIDGDWLYPGKQHELALSQVERMLITVNRRDLVLRTFTRLSGRRVEAVGTTGLVEKWRLGEQRSKVIEIDASPWLGCLHLWSRYAENPQAAARLRPYFFNMPSP
ncbi:MAG: hypothetical protein WD847_19665 [Pirellulales bacterium]